MNKLSGSELPDWVSETILRYLAHTEQGQTIRDLARQVGCHASTILRQVRRIESRRDDPLVDAALGGLASQMNGGAEEGGSPLPDDAMLQREATRVLRRLCESGAVLAVAEGMDKAVVVRGTEGSSEGTRTAIVQVPIAQVLALLDWIHCARPGRISRYTITPAGRGALGQYMAQSENRAVSAGFAEAQTAFTGPGQAANNEPRRVPRTRYGTMESPLTLLARRRDRDGKPFLEDALVRAGERLREDFELAQMGENIAQNWDSFLTAGVDSNSRGDGQATRGPGAARRRVEQALSDLGPGLNDVALRCCCYLEGLEEAEKRMGWSARSGKIVLRIALQRLRRHYEATKSEDQQMVG